MEHALAGVLTNDKYRHVITAVVEEVTAAPSKDDLALKLMPPVDYPAAFLEHEVLSGSGGLTQERALGSPGKAVAGQSSSPKVYAPGYYQEHVPFREKELMMLRKLGTIGERGITGLTNGELNWIDMAARKLKKRIRNRMTKLVWDAFFTGAFTYMGTTYNFGIPAGNALTSATDWTVANVGKPFEDLVALIGQNAALRKYRPLIKGFIINPVTEANIIQRALEAKYITNNNIVSGGINEVKKFAAPGLPDFLTVADAWQDETVNADGSISLGQAQFFVPDNKVLVLIDFAGADVLFPQYGQLQLTENVNDPSASIEKPATGIYTFVDEEGLRDRKAPRVDIVGGFNGGPNLMRPNDVFIISV